MRQIQLSGGNPLHRKGFLIEEMMGFELFLSGVAENAGALAVLLQVKSINATGHDDAFESDSEWFAPYRRLLTADQVAMELRNTGFVIQFQRAIEQKDSRKPMLMQIRAGQRIC